MIEDMDRHPADPKDTIDLQERKQFAASAKSVLYNVSLAYADPVERKRRLGWLEGGWTTRIDRTYVNGGIDPAQCPMIPSSKGGSSSATQISAK